MSVTCNNEAVGLPVCALPTNMGVLPNRRGKSSSASHHAFERYSCNSVAVQSSELMYLPVKQLHLRAKSLVAKVKQGGRRGRVSSIDEPIDLDRKGTYVFPSPEH